MYQIQLGRISFFGKVTDDRVCSSLLSRLSSSRTKKFSSKNYFLFLIHYCSRTILMHVIMLYAQFSPNTIFSLTLSFIVLLVISSPISAWSRIIIKLQYEIQLDIHSEINTSLIRTSFCKKCSYSRYGTFKKYYHIRMEIKPKSYLLEMEQSKQLAE